MSSPIIQILGGTLALGGGAAATAAAIRAVSESRVPDAGKVRLQFRPLDPSVPDFTPIPGGVITPPKKLTFAPPPPDAPFEWVTSPQGWKIQAKRLREGAAPGGGFWFDTGTLNLRKIFIKSAPRGAWCIRETDMGDVFSLLTYLPQWRSWEKRVCGSGSQYLVKYPWLKELIGPGADLKGVLTAAKSAAKAVGGGFTGQWGKAIEHSISAVESAIDQKDRAKAAATVAGAMANAMQRIITDDPRNAHLVRPSGSLDLRKRFRLPLSITRAMVEGATPLEAREMRKDAGTSMPLVWVPNKP